MELSECRKKLDEIDAKIVALFEERMSVSEEVAACKAEHHLPILDAAREEEKLEMIRHLAADPKNAKACAELFEKIMELSRNRQEQIL